MDWRNPYPLGTQGSMLGEKLYLETQKEMKFVQRHATRRCIKNPLTNKVQINSRTCCIPKIQITLLLDYSRPIKHNLGKAVRPNFTGLPLCRVSICKHLSLFTSIISVQNKLAINTVAWDVKPFCPIQIYRYTASTSRQLTQASLCKCLRNDSVSSTLTSPETIVTSGITFISNHSVIS